MNWDDIKKDYENSTDTLKVFAEKHGIKLGTLKSKISRGKWKRNSKKKVATKKEKDATKERKVATEKVAKQLDANDTLTEKQKLFCLYYLQSFNATQSYLKAYKGTYGTAGVEGSRLLANPKIKREMDRIKTEIQDDLKVTIADIAREHAKMAFSDLGDYLEFGTDVNEKRDEFDGIIEVTKDSFVKLKSSDQVDTSLIKEIKEGRDGISFKLYDRQKSLERLERYIPKGNGETPTEDKIKEAQLKKLEAEANLANHKAEKITFKSKDNALLKALLDVKKGGDGSGE